MAHHQINFMRMVGLHIYSWSCGDVGSTCRILAFVTRYADSRWSYNYSPIQVGDRVRRPQVRWLGRALGCSVLGVIYSSSSAESWLRSRDWQVAPIHGPNCHCPDGRNPNALSHLGKLLGISNRQDLIIQLVPRVKKSFSPWSLLPALPTVLKPLIFHLITTHSLTILANSLRNGCYFAINHSSTNP